MHMLNKIIKQIKRRNLGSEGTGMSRFVPTPDIFNKPSVNANILVLGTPGSGKVYHPWDNLKPCPCGCKERPLLMYEKDKLYYCGLSNENIFAICSVCGRHTEKTELVTAINNWNTDKTISDTNEVISR